MKIAHQSRTQAVARALTAEESFAHAAQRFEDPYGFAVGRTTVREADPERLLNLARNHW